jgi:hypothetical protein
MHFLMLMALLLMLPIVGFFQVGLWILLAAYLCSWEINWPIFLAICVGSGLLSFLACVAKQLAD